MACSKNHTRHFKVFKGILLLNVMDEDCAIFYRCHVSTGIDLRKIEIDTDIGLFCIYDNWI